MYPDQPAVLDPRFGGSPIMRTLRRVFGASTQEDRLVYPGAVQKFQMRTQGRYANGFPIGAVVHSTEGRCKNGNQDAENTITGTGIPNGHCYFCISSTGTVYQSFLLDRWGNHAGSTWHPQLGTGLSNKLVGIEMCCPGIVTKQGSVYKPEWNETFTEAEVRFSEKVENVTKRGHYVRFTEAQETALMELILWMHRTNPAVFKLENVYGHDEIAVEAGTHALGRKQDPGASLSVYMPEFRRKLIAAVPVS
jgi:N-acetyl-anhydromuramyl-L-alanine amidase AmpD